MRRLTIDVPGDTAEAVQFTSGVIAGLWSDPPQVYAWSTLDVLREQWPDAVLTWLDEEPVWRERAGGAEAAHTDLIRVAAYVSRGRGHVDVEPYPDALARKALGALDAQPAALDRPEENP